MGGPFCVVWAMHTSMMSSIVGLRVGSSLQHSCSISQIRSGITVDEGRCGRSPSDTLDMIEFLCTLWNGLSPDKTCVNVK